MSLPVRRAGSRSAGRGNGRVETAGQPDISGAEASTGRVCRTCPTALTPTDIAHGIVRCRQCRKANPGARTRARGQAFSGFGRDRAHRTPTCTESWWAVPLTRDQFRGEIEKRFTRDGNGDQR